MQSRNGTSRGKVDAVQYVRPLTGIRALAALLVLGLHTEQNIRAGLNSVLPFFERGYLGVDFFFILSGFIITHVYLDKLSHFDARAIKIFLWHRFVRLYPVHITVLVALVGVVFVAHVGGFPLNNPSGWSGSEVFWQIVLLQAWGVVPKPGWNAPSWSISAEWFAYLLFPLLALALARVRSKYLGLAIAIASLTAMATGFWLLEWDLNAWAGAPALARVSGEFLCGAALCRVVSLSRKQQSVTGDVVAAAAFLAFLVGASIGIHDAVLTGLLAITVFGTAASAGFLAAALGSRPAVWLGEISYSIYMVHFPILIVMRRFWERIGIGEWDGSGKTLAFLITVLLVTAFASLLFYAVERPARIRLRDQLGRFENP